MEGVKYTGALGATEKEQVLPPVERTAKGPVAVMNVCRRFPVIRVRKHVRSARSRSDRTSPGCPVWIWINAAGAGFA